MLSRDAIKVLIRRKREMWSLYVISGTIYNKLKDMGQKIFLIAMRPDCFSGDYLIIN